MTSHEQLSNGNSLSPSSYDLYVEYGISRPLSSTFGPPTYALTREGVSTIFQGTQQLSHNDHLEVVQEREREIKILWILLRIMVLLLKI